MKSEWTFEIDIIVNEALFECDEYPTALVLMDEGHWYSG